MNEYGRKCLQVIDLYSVLCDVRDGDPSCGLFHVGVHDLKRSALETVIDLESVGNEYASRSAYVRAAAP